MKTNKEIIKEVLDRKGYTIGCFNDNINQLNKVNLKKVTEQLESDNHYIYVYLNRVKQVIEVDVVDDEVDLNIITLQEYCKQYRHDEKEYYERYKA